MLIYMPNNEFGKLFNKKKYYCIRQWTQTSIGMRGTRPDKDFRHGFKKNVIKRSLFSPKGAYRPFKHKNYRDFTHGLCIFFIQNTQSVHLLRADPASR